MYIKLYLLYLEYDTAPMFTFVHSFGSHEVKYMCFIYEFVIKQLHIPILFGEFLMSVSLIVKREATSTLLARSSTDTTPGPMQYGQGIMPYSGCLLLITGVDLGFMEWCGCSTSIQKTLVISHIIKTTHILIQ